MSRGSDAMRRITVTFGVSEDLYTELLVTAARLGLPVHTLFSDLMQHGAERLARERLFVLRSKETRKNGGLKS